MSPAALLLLLLGPALGHRAPPAAAFLEEAAGVPGRGPLLAAASRAAARGAPRPQLPRPRARPGARPQPRRAYGAYGPASGAAAAGGPAFWRHRPIEGGSDDAVALLLETFRESDEDMAMVDATPLGRTGEAKLIALPAEWAWKLHVGTVRYLQLDSPLGKDLSVLGRLKERPDQEVEIERWQSACPATARHFRIHEMLSDLPCVRKNFEQRSFEDWTFALVEEPTHTWFSFIAGHMAEWKSSTEPAVPLETALPLMIDILAGMREVSARGVVMTDIHRYKIRVSPDGSRMVLDDFRHSCVEHSTDPEVSCADAFTTPPLRLAPEIAGDVADRVSSNQWQLGLLFAQMLLGVDPVADLARRMHSDGSSDSEGARALIRDVARRHFVLWETPGFRDLIADYADVLRIVSGLLEKSPDMRWTVEEAWREAVQVAEARGIPINRGPRVPQTVLEEWGA